MPIPVVDFIEWTPHAVHLGCRDGVYLNKTEAPHCYQIIVVGPMPLTPGEYCEALIQRIGHPMWIAVHEVMGGDYLSEDEHKVFDARGFTSIVCAAWDFLNEARVRWRMTK